MNYKILAAATLAAVVAQASDDTIKPASGRWETYGFSRDPGFAGDTTWLLVEIVADVPMEAGSSTTGFNMAGSGKAWIMEQPRFEVVGPGVPVTVLPRSATREPGPDLQLR